jgi:2,4-dienoyl-CoA reductase (NADPH2)
VPASGGIAPPHGGAAAGEGPDAPAAAADDPIFRPLRFRHLTLKNRILRSSISGRFDNYDGSGTQARLNWEERFARGGAAAIISSFVPVHVEGRILPNYAMIDADDKVPFWRRVAERVHAHDCRYILQLSHSGRQRDLPGIENLMRPALSSTGRREPVHGFLCRPMTADEIRATVRRFAEGARRAREAGLDGVELHASHGYLFTQFLSSAVNDRKDEYGGSLENRARLLLETIRAIRKEVGEDFHLQVKINARDLNDAVFPWERRGNSLDESIQVCRWVEEAGADALHVSIGSMFPHPLLPPGGLPVDELRWCYGALVASGVRGYLNYTLFHFRLLRPLFTWFWNRTKKTRPVEGVCAEEARAVKRGARVPVISTGGYQDARLIRKVIGEGWCDAVAVARPLIANNDLPRVFASGRDLPERPCSFCNRCLVNAVANPLGCYDVRRFGGDREAMVREILSVFRGGDGGAP